MRKEVAHHRGIEVPRFGRVNAQSRNTRAQKYKVLTQCGQVRRKYRRLCVEPTCHYKSVIQIAQHHPEEAFSTPLLFFEQKNSSVTLD